jgi:transposase
MRNKKKQSRKKLDIMLSNAEIAALQKVGRVGAAPARTITRARILLLSHKGKTNTEITEALDCSHDLVNLVRKRYHEREGIEAAITDAPRPGQPKKITPAHETFVTATACTAAPDGHAHWTLDALRNKLLETYDDLESVSHERIRTILIRAALKPWREKNVVHSKAHPGVPGTHG